MIQNLDDSKAQQILAAIVRSRKTSGAQAPPWSPGLEETLVQEFHIEPGTATASQGDLARQALLVLAEDPSTRTAIETMAANWNDSPQKFDFGASAGLRRLCYSFCRRISNSSALQMGSGV